jgi:hypothetical protein
MRRLLAIALLFVSSAAFAAPLAPSSSVATLATVQATRVNPSTHALRLGNLKFGILKIYQTGPRTAEQGDLTF